MGFMQWQLVNLKFIVIYNKWNECVNKETSNGEVQITVGFKSKRIIQMLYFTVKQDSIYTAYNIIIQHQKVH